MSAALREKKMLLHGICKMSITDCGAPLPIIADKDLYAWYKKVQKNLMYYHTGGAKVDSIAIPLFQIA